MEHWVSVQLHGSFTVDEAAYLRDTLSRLISPTGIVRVDLHDVEALSRPAVIALVDVARLARRIDCEYTIVAASPILSRLCVGLDHHDRELLGLHAIDGA